MIGRWRARKEQEREAQRVRDAELLAERERLRAAESARRQREQHELEVERRRDEQRQQEVAAKIAEGRRIREEWLRTSPEAEAERARAAEAQRIKDAEDVLAQEAARRERDWLASLTEGQREERRRREETTERLVEAERRRQEAEALRAEERRQRAISAAIRKRDSDRDSAEYEEWERQTKFWTHPVVLLDSTQTFTGWRRHGKTFRDVRSALHFLTDLGAGQSIQELWVGDLVRRRSGPENYEAFRIWSPVELLALWGSTPIGPGIGKIVTIGIDLPELKGQRRTVERVDPYSSKYFTRRD